MIKVMLLSFLLINTIFFSMQTDGQTQAEVWTKFPILLTVVQDGLEDNSGNSGDVYSITVDFDGDPYRNSNAYNILYYEDAKPTQEFRNQTLPFSFKRDYKGLMPGGHEVRIDIEYGLEILASKATTVTVANKGLK